MGMDTYCDALDFLERSGIREARLLGGEPTLHPNFSQMVEMALERGFRVVVFSNGHIPKEALNYLETISPDSLSLQVNILTDPECFNGISAALAGVLSRLKDRIIPGLSLDSPKTDPGLLLEIVKNYGTKHRVRLGIAHPKIEGDNHFLNPKYYKIAGEKIAVFYKNALEAGIKVDFDCGFVPCMFPEWSYELLGDSLRTIGMHCSPIIDIMEDQTVVSCLPLSGLGSAQLTRELDATALRAYFQEEYKHLRKISLFKDCQDCLFKRSGFCLGGCLSASIQRARKL